MIVSLYPAAFAVGYLQILLFETIYAKWRVISN